jgi:hypothetical protein
MAPNTRGGAVVMASNRRTAIAPAKPQSEVVKRCKAALDSSESKENKVSLRTDIEERGKSAESAIVCIESRRDKDLEYWSTPKERTPPEYPAAGDDMLPTVVTANSKLGDTYSTVSTFTPGGDGEGYHQTHKSVENSIRHFVNHVMIKKVKFISHEGMMDYGQPISEYVLDNLKVMVEPNRSIFWHAHKKSVTTILNRKRNNIRNCIYAAYKGKE